MAALSKFVADAVAEIDAEGVDKNSKRFDRMRIKFQGDGHLATPEFRAMGIDSADLFPWNRRPAAVAADAHACGKQFEPPSPDAQPVPREDEREQNTERESEPRGIACRAAERGNEKCSGTACPDERFDLLTPSAV